MSNLNWSDLPRKATIKCGADVLSYRFVTTKSETYKGYFGIEPDSSSGHLTPRLWISKRPGGKPLKQRGADVAGQGAKLSWSQADNPARGIELKRGRVYYLNHQLLPIGDGKKPTRSVSFIRNASTQGGAVNNERRTKKEF